MIDGAGDPDRRPGYREPQAAKQLPKRFYQQVSVGEEGGEFRILLDGRPVRTPRKALLALGSRELAEAVAAEWRSQGVLIDPVTMPLTRLLNSALEGVAGREGEVAADIVKYAGSDLICYRADGPRELTARQARHWDPVLAWAHATLGCRFVLAQGVMPVAQSAAALRRVAEALKDQNALRLAALHVMTTLLGSALLSLAHANGALTVDSAWAAAHVDEDFQAEQWGEDGEAAARRRLRWAEFDAASKILALTGG